MCRLSTSSSFYSRSLAFIAFSLSILLSTHILISVYYNVHKSALCNNLMTDIMSLLSFEEDLITVFCGPLSNDFTAYRNLMHCNVTKQTYRTSYIILYLGSDKFRLLHKWLIGFIANKIWHVCSQYSTHIQLDVWACWMHAIFF